MRRLLSAFLDLLLFVQPTQDAIRSRAQQSLAQLIADTLSITARAAGSVPDDILAVDCGNQTTQVQLSVKQLGMTCHRHRATAAEARIHGALGTHTTCRHLIVQRPEQGFDVRIAAPAFNADGTLTDSRQHMFSAQGVGRRTIQAKTFESGGSQHDGVVIALLQAPKAGRHIATQIEQLEQQVAALAQEEAITRFVEDSVRVTLVRPRGGEFDFDDEF
jgi:hypothetical protein